MARTGAVGKLSEIIEREGDPKTNLMQAVGDLTDEAVLHAQVLVAIYPGEKYHHGTSIIRTDRNVQEAMFQGTVGVVLKTGPGAFVDAPGASFHGMKAGIGDWVLFRPADGLHMQINEVPCRLFEDVSIKMIVSDPARYW